MLSFSVPFYMLQVCVCNAIILGSICSRCVYNAIILSSICSRCLLNALVLVPKDCPIKISKDTL